MQGKQSLYGRTTVSNIRLGILQDPFMKLTWSKLFSLQYGLPWALSTVVDGAAAPWLSSDTSGRRQCLSCLHAEAPVKPVVSLMNSLASWPRIHVGNEHSEPPWNHVMVSAAGNINPTLQVKISILGNLHPPQWTLRNSWYLKTSVMWSQWC